MRPLPFSLAGGNLGDDGAEELAVGVGGYEWTVGDETWSVKVLSDSIEDFVEPATEDRLSGTSVRQLKINPAVVWYGDVFGMGVRGIQTPGGNEGPLIRMYHPRFGL